MATSLGINHLAIHILQLEKSLKLYREILGFALVDAEILRSPGCEEMLVLHLKAGESEIRLSLTSPQNWHQVDKIGNTNHNHFTLKVDEIEPIVEALIAEGYVMEHPDYKGLPFNFFVGPNGEIIGLTQA